MKAYFHLILLAALSLVFASCETDLPPDPNAQNATNKFARGISGHGTITPPNTQDDPLSPENSNGGH